jgi:regulator of replication initiation timing
MLDTLISRKPDGGIKFQVYRKPTHTDQYLQFESHQPMEHKLGVIRTLKHRANTIVSEEEDLKTELQHVKKVLSVSGYTKWTWQAPGSRKKTPHPSSDNSTKPKGHVTLPYISGITEVIARKMRNVGIRTHSKPHTTIRSLLVAPKDRDDPMDTSGVVYHLKCNDCSAQYIGETERPLKKRLKEHQRDSSPVAQHLNECQHQLDSKVKILDKDKRWFERGIREAIHIRDKMPSLNRDQGRHHLSPLYNTLIRSRDVTSRSVATSREHTN